MAEKALAYMLFRNLNHGQNILNVSHTMIQRGYMIMYVIVDNWFVGKALSRGLIWSDIWGASASANVLNKHRIEQFNNWRLERGSNIGQIKSLKLKSITTTIVLNVSVLNSVLGLLTYALRNMHAVLSCVFLNFKCMHSCTLRELTIKSYFGWTCFDQRLR